MPVKALKIAVLLILAGFLFGCENSPELPEAAAALKQEHDLWKSGAEIYASGEYLKYKKALRDARDKYVKERSRFVWFRDIDEVAKEFGGVIELGGKLGKQIEDKKAVSKAEAERLLSLIGARVDTLKRLTSFLNEGRLSRKDLTTAELLVSEAKSNIGKGKYGDAMGRLKKASTYTVFATESLLPILTRFSDRSQITKWRSWADEAIRESEATGGYSIVVSKIDRRLFLYKGGRVLREYEAGIGFNGSKDKLYAGDKATPEGRYRVIKKISRSRFYKALLINYPNDADRAQFAAAKRKGLIPKHSGIGGLIEIHGGGNDGMTYGCVGLDNNRMEELYNLVGVGTPVTIVGALVFHNGINEAVNGLKD